MVETKGIFTNLPSFTFDDPALFRSIRDTLLTDRGLYAAYDGTYELYLAAADATFYDLETFVRDFNYVYFTDYVSSQTMSGTIRAMVNGQKYIADTNKPPNQSKWSGELIQFGNMLNGRLDTNANIKRHFGKASGRTQKAYINGLGKPSLATPPLKHALSSLLPLIVDSCPYTAEQNAPVIQNGKPVECFSKNILDQSSYYLNIYGKTVYGIHRTYNLVFFLVQPQELTDGISLRPLIEKLALAGVQDAVLGDGNTSSFLAVDGIVEAWSWKANYKNLTIPSGFQLQLSSLEVLSGTTTFTAVNDADLANKVGSLPAELVGAQVKLEWTASGPVMTITRLGGTLTGFDLKLDTQPVVLPHQVMSSNDLTQGTTFEYKTGDITFTVNSILTVDDPDDPGRLSGYFKITQGSTPTETFLCEGDFFWFLA